MSAEISIRVARLDDATTVEQVLQTSYPALMAGVYESALLARALPLMTRANPKLLGTGTYYLAEAGGEVVGCGGWSLEKPGTTSVKPGVGHIRHFGTAETWTGRGVGRAIYGRCETNARAAGVRLFECYASRNGEPFYTALGFRRIASIEVPMGSDVAFPSLYMSRQI